MTGRETPIERAKRHATDRKRAGLPPSVKPKALTPAEARLRAIESSPGFQEWKRKRDERERR